ncbi:MAG: diaminopimelate decarboxylase [Omnitrophica WOR_2 bacterium RIFCSPLOWO2_12_FULL_46_30]|nr:MAG: diaminopimelate decarboxylase [Omnitrophica WOR_2 bacterium RIFCSPHIGHO2_02_FULL_46_37]OGX42396.1 MAG: diaminopimelate decarboxylase [Omnitrophica WOR_2 bacterium RIFCSPLOWO2_02_FULL_45_28]OGX50374.1 MAG: diaminopimelate decarboxylase [Omnitrophica WOR_2 bacterium RIFCSPLOWO2_12_FULL_46_30]
MREFRYKNNQLYCEAVRIADIAKKVITPFYLYSYTTLLDHYRKLAEAFSSLRPLICYSMKANSNLSICRALVKAGSGLDIVSGGELYKALLAGCSPKKIVYASVGKTEEEIRRAVAREILFFNVESLSELELINKVAKDIGKAASVALRINPDVEPGTHTYITTGKLTNKFGIDFDAAYKILQNKAKFSSLNFKGLHIHIGSQIIQARPYVLAIKKMAGFIAKLKKELIEIEYLNIGGGLGIIYAQEKPQTAGEFSRKVSPILKNTGLKIILEPGRFIAGNAGILVSKVLYLKKTPLKNFVIMDAGMNDLIRPSLYGAYHEILPLRKTRQVRGARNKVDVVGPLCESGDFFAKDRILPEVKEGDYLSIMSAGAYGFSMASNYNCRLKPAEVMVKGDKFYIVRKRDSYLDLVRKDIIPEFLK